MVDQDRFQEKGFLKVSSPEIDDMLEEISQSLKSVSEQVLRHHNHDFSDTPEYESMTLGEIVDWCDQNEDGNEITGSMYDVFRTSPAVQGAVNHRTILDIAEAIGIEQPSVGTSPNVRIDRPGDKEYKTPAHQDYWFSLLSDISLVYWIPVRPLSKDMGLLEVIPGSHKEGVIPFEEYEQGHEPYYPIDEPEDEEYEEVMLENDEILVFDQKLLHRSGFNTSEKCRISLQIRMNDLATARKPAATFIPSHSSYVNQRQDELLEEWH